MKKCTDLNSLKEIARCLLYTDVHRVENYLSQSLQMIERPLLTPYPTKSTVR